MHRDRRLDPRLMTSAEDALCGLRQGGLRLERYVEEFLEISNRMSWHEAALGACFLLGLDDEVIRCDGMVPTRKSRKFPGLVIPLQLERAASPQLIPRREPPHTSPTAPTACPTPRIPPASEAAPSSSALSRRP